MLQGTRKLVKTIEAGGFFGEVALVKKIDSRAADCIARGRVKVSYQFQSIYSCCSGLVLSFSKTWCRRCQWDAMHLRGSWARQSRYCPSILRSMSASMQPPAALKEVQPKWYRSGNATAVLQRYHGWAHVAEAAQQLCDSDESVSGQPGGHQGLQCSQAAPLFQLDYLLCSYEGIALPLSQHNRHG